MQTSGVELAMATVRPEVLVALMIRGVVETCIPVGRPKVILCAVRGVVIVLFTVTTVAAA